MGNELGFVIAGHLTGVTDHCLAGTPQLGTVANSPNKLEHIEMCKLARSYTLNKRQNVIEVISEEKRYPFALETAKFAVGTI